MSLEIAGVWKSFSHKGKSQRVLRGVDLAVEPGEFVCFIGHSGCGKSTLLNCIGGLLGGGCRVPHAGRSSHRRPRS